MTEAAPLVTADEPSVASCRNCGETLAPPLPNYCGHCGQETLLRPPTVMEFAQQFGGSYISTEGALWRTLKLLLLRPGHLTREYLDGRRRRYVLPLRLYLTISVIALLLMRIDVALHDSTAERISVQIKAPVTQAEQTFTVDLGFARFGNQTGSFRCEGLPKSWCAHLEKRIALASKPEAQLMHELPQRLLGYTGTTMFLLLPLFAGLLKLTYWNRGMRWSEHLIFALHLHAFWFAMLALQISGIPAALAIPVYSLLAANCVYGGRPWVTAGRAIFLALIYGPALLTALVFMAIWAFVA